MGKNFLFFFYFLFFSLNAQNFIKGTVLDARTKKPLSKVIINIKGGLNEIQSDEKGNFQLKSTQNQKNQSLLFQKEGYKNFSKEIDFNLSSISILEIYLEPIINLVEEELIFLDQAELDSDESIFSGSSLLQASRDLYSQISAFEWGPFWFRNRGYQTLESQVLFDGIAFENPLKGGINFNTWSGINDITRYPREGFLGIESSDYNFGKAGENLYFSTRASDFQKGIRLNSSLANRSYNGRLMATYSTGMMENGWAFTLSSSFRGAGETTIKGNHYEALACFLAIEKKINQKHSLNLSTLGVPFSRGRNAALRKEVLDLKSNLYNPNWGWQNGKKRNTVIQKAFEPNFMLSHFWELSKKTKINSTLGYQFGFNSRSRLDRGFAGSHRFNSFIEDPSAIYYRKLPSFFSDEEKSNKVKNLFLRDENVSQINWANLYEENLDNVHRIYNYNGNGRSIEGNAAKYYLSEDYFKNQKIDFISRISSDLNENISFIGVFSFLESKIENYKKISDLLGAYFVYDVDTFAFDKRSHFDLLQTNKVAFLGDKVNYHYLLNRRFAELYTNFNFSYSFLDFSLGLNLAKTQLWRIGKFKHYLFSENSYEHGPKRNFFNYGIKANFLFKTHSFHNFELNLAYKNRAPSLDQTFPNARFSHLINPNLKSPTFFSSEIHHIYKSNRFSSKATFYYTDFRNDSLIYRYFSPKLKSFLTELSTEVESKHLGGELAAEFEFNSKFKLQGALNLSDFFYSNFPKVYFLKSQESEFEEKGQAKIKNQKVSGGPQQAYHLGIKYSSTRYWWSSISGNLLRKNYLNFIPGLSTEKFSEFENQEAFANRLLPSGFFINLSAGKSWRIKNMFLFASFNLSNLLNNKSYKSSGYPNLQNTKNDKEDQSILVSQYWPIQGRLFFLNLTLRM